MNSLSEINFLSGGFPDGNVFKFNALFDILPDLVIFLNLFFTKHGILCTLNNSAFLLVLFRDLLNNLAFVFLFDLSLLHILLLLLLLFEQSKG